MHQNDRHSSLFSLVSFSSFFVRLNILCSLFLEWTSSVTFPHEKHADRPLHFSAVLPASISSCLALGHRIACVTLLLLWQASPTWRGRLVATYSSSGTTHTYIYRLLCFFIYFGRGAERLCVWPVFVLGEGQDPRHNHPQRQQLALVSWVSSSSPLPFRALFFCAFKWNGLKRFCLYW